MESSRQRFFHLLNDFAYIEVSDLRPSRERVSSLRPCCHRRHQLGGFKPTGLSLSQFWSPGVQNQAVGRAVPSGSSEGGLAQACPLLVAAGCPRPPPTG